ncbi:MAG: hypothetical protein JSR98_10245, partial [Proteobacteria bacterium]|nr:hypothetical protein [Pseudomonadota bacterium]
AGVSAFGLLGGCITAPFHDAQVDPRSPIAAEVAKTVRADAPYPTFAAFPAKPKGLRPVRQYGRDAADVEGEGARIVKATAEETWTLKDTEGFAAQAQIDAGPKLAPANPEETEAFAKSQKARANPPSPTKR